MMQTCNSFFLICNLRLQSVIRRSTDLIMDVNKSHFASKLCNFDHKWTIWWFGNVEGIWRNSSFRQASQVVIIYGVLPFKNKFTKGLGGITNYVVK
jgi:hypothetical protein